MRERQPTVSKNFFLYSVSFFTVLNIFAHIKWILLLWIGEYFYFFFSELEYKYDGGQKKFIIIDWNTHIHFYGLRIYFTSYFYQIPVKVFDD